MTDIEAKVKRWGNSLAVVIPSHVVEAKKINENDTIHLLVIPDSRKAFMESFGMLKGKIKKSSQQIKDELRRELYNN